MKEQIIQKSLEAFLTGAKVIGEEGRVLISEVINYMLFSAILNTLKTLAWGLLIFGIYKVGKCIINAMTLGCDHDKNEVSEKYNLLIKEAKEGKNTIYSVEEYEAIKLRKINETKAPVDVVKGVVYSILFIITIYQCINTLETLRPVGKILTAPRLVLLQEGAVFLQTLQKK